MSDRPVRPARVMVQMKLAMMRHSLRDPTLAGWMYTGATIGLLLAMGSIAVAVLSPAMVPIILALWMLGWVVGPLFAGGGDEALRPEYFTSIGLPRRDLARSLLAGSCVGIGAGVSLVALLALVVVGWRAGPLATIVSVLAVVTSLLMLVAVSKLAVALYGLLLRVRVGAILAGLVSAFVLAFTAQGWALIAAFVSNDVSGIFADATTYAPSGWGLLAVQAAGRGEWLTTVAALAGSLLISAVALWGWSVLLARRTVTTRFGVRPRRLLTAHDAASAAVAKERRSLSRDLLSSNRLTFALAYGLFFCLMPLAIAWTGMLPWAGPLFVVMAGAVSANLYGSDGTALWMLLATPDAENLDVRARQRAWLGVVAPVAVVVTVGLTLVADQPAQWPYVAAALPALLGGAAGVIVFQSVFAAVPTIDPHKRSGNPLNVGGESESSGLMFLAMIGIIVLASPAVLVAWQWGWWGSVVGVATGVLWWWWLGRLAARRLHSHGVELLTLLRHGRSGRSGAAANPLSSLPASQRRLVLVCFGLGAIPLFPQGVVPLIFLMTGNPTKAWFLAMFVPRPWSWLVAAVMITLGLAMYTYAAVVYRRAVTGGRTAPIAVRTA